MLKIAYQNSCYIFKLNFLLSNVFPASKNANMNILYFFKSVGLLQKVIVVLFLRDFKRLSDKKRSYVKVLNERYCNGLDANAQIGCIKLLTN